MNAFYPVDKEAGISSFGVIAALRRILKMRKIGHCGTLDPFATGLLICATGQFTRLLSYLEAMDKCYEAEILLGKKSSTGDPEGEVIAESPVNIQAQDWDQLRDRVLSLKELPIPQYSAVKIDGKRAYRYAREGQTIEMPLREVQILDFEILSEPIDNRFRYHAKVSKGTYIRALSEYIAEALGTCGMTIALRRTAISGWRVEDSYCLSDLQSQPEHKVIPPRALLSHLPSFTLPDDRHQAFINGNSSYSDMPDCSDLVVYGSQDRLLGIGKVQDGELKPKIVLSGD